MATISQARPVAFLGVLDCCFTRQTLGSYYMAVKVLAMLTLGYCYLGYLADVTYVNASFLKILQPQQKHSGSIYSLAVFTPFS